MDKIIELILKYATPEIVEMLRKIVAEFKTRAGETPNPYDDMLAAFLQALIGEPSKSQ